jgi:hypothetical protein
LDFAASWLASVDVINPHSAIDSQTAETRHRRALPVFDCVVVKASTEVVKKIMQQEFKPVAGLT